MRARLHETRSAAASGPRTWPRRRTGGAWQRSTGPSILSACTGDPLGSFDYCSVDCPCEAGQGDCDDDTECATGLVCMRDTGGLFGLDPELDICMTPCSIEALGTPDFCAPGCLCGHGQGDCDDDSDCAAGNECVKNVGASYGFAPDVDVCVATCEVCSPECPCEHDCDNHLDDDADGLLDCADPECAGNAGCGSAPALDRTIAPSFGDAVGFLYQGPDAVQVDADPAAFDAARITVLRGRVSDRDDLPLAGVQITVLHGDAYGYTETNADGTFDFVVNGGGVSVVRYDAAGFLPAQRLIETGYHEYRWLPDVTLIPRDTAVTEIVPGAADAQVARGSVQADADGSRQATLIFPAGTQATAHLPDGSQTALGTMHVRATEYTVGLRGPAAMPGSLPPTSGYTYAVELSIDEAEALGASSVVFDRPVGFYVDNFLSFPVGTTVPLGYYDRQQGRWVPADSGVVLAIVAIADDLATLDLDGDGAAEDETALAAAGIDQAERAELATLYAAGKTLWRVSIPHFTPWDTNWPLGPPDDAIYPDTPELARHPSPNEPCIRSGSVIQCERQSLGQLVAVPATHVTLAYHGHRKRGWEPDHQAVLQLTSDTYPASLKAVELEVEIAGQRTTQRLGVSSKLEKGITWNGRDGYGRAIQGTQRANVRIGYIYDGAYGNAARFGNQARGLITGSITREEVTLWRKGSLLLGGWDAAPQGLGGFGLTSHHVYNPETQTLYLGDGTRRSANSVAPVMDDAGTPGTSGSIYAVEAAPDGGLYTVMTDGRIHHIAPDGTVTLKAAGLADPRDLALAPDGTLYVAEHGADRVIAIAPDGAQSIAAGGGAVSFDDMTGRAIPATDAALRGPTALALAPDGSLYFLDRAPQDVFSKVRVVDPAGMLSNVHALVNGRDLALGPDGSLYVTQGGSVIRRITPDGRVTLVQNDDAGSSLLTGVVVRADGTLLVSDMSTGHVVHIASDGATTIVAGGGEQEASDGAISKGTVLPGQAHLALDATEALVLTDGQRIYRVHPDAPSLFEDHIVVPSRDGASLYIFDRDGRHQETRDALTQAVLRAFGYDAQGRLTSMLDARQELHEYHYDESSRLVTDIGPTGYTQSLAPVQSEDSARSVEVTTSASRATRYEVVRAGLDRIVRTVRTTSGHRGTVEKTANTRHVTAPDGTVLHADLVSDPR